MRIAIIGYGKMGKAIAALAEKSKHEIVSIIRSHNADDIHSLHSLKPDVAIEFSTPQSAVTNLKSLISQSIPVVCGTTAWHDEYEAVCDLVKEKDSALLYASNFSIGMNLMFDFNRQLASIMSHFDQYNPSIEEIHHTQKLDAPSGTAVTLADDIIAQRTDTEHWALAEDAQDDQLPIKAVREGKVIGTHHVRYSSAIDDIQLSHIAHNRDGFVAGALLAAEFIADKKGIFTMQDVLSSALK